MGWSLFDIGCCCGEDDCGCPLIETYTNDFSVEIETDWEVLTGDANDLPEIVSGELWTADWDASANDNWPSGMTRCVSFPDMTDKYLYWECKIVDVPYICNLQLRVSLRSLLCEQEFLRLDARSGAVSNSRDYLVLVEGVLVDSDVISGLGEGSVLRIEIDNAEVRFLLDSVVEFTWVWPYGGNLFDDYAAADLEIRLEGIYEGTHPSGTQHYAKADDIAYGVDDL